MLEHKDNKVDTRDIKQVIVYPNYVFQPIKDIVRLLANSFNSCGVNTKMLPCANQAMLNDIITQSSYNRVISINTHDYLEQEKKFSLSKPKCLLMAYNLEQSPIKYQSSPWASMRLGEVGLYGSYFHYILTESSCKTHDVKAIGLRSLHLDIPYHESFDPFAIHKPEEKTHDIFFVGCGSPKRDNLISKIKENGLSVYELKQPGSFYAKEKLEAVLKSKICLNVHFSDMEYFEKPRVFMDYFINKAFTISEKIEYPEHFKNTHDLFMSKYQNLLAMVVMLANSYEARGKDFIKMGENAYNTYKDKYYYKEVITNFMQELSNKEFIVMGDNK